MNLALFFSPVEDSVYKALKEYRTFYKSIKIFDEKMPVIDQAEIALIGLTENRGTFNNLGVDKAVLEIRKKLYRLKKGSGPYKIVDLGNLNPGIDLEETQLRLKEVCEHLIGRNILPIIMGGSHDMDYGQYRAYEGMEKLISVLNVDAFIDLDDSNSASLSQSHIQKIILHDPNYLFHYCHLAYQSYLTDPVSLELLSKMYFESFRIGEMRTSIKEMEPYIRDADMFSFDITAIKSSDAPGNENAQPFGLTGEEACQICWYAGLNEKISSAGFYEYNPLKDDANLKTAAVVATMIWYFIEGYYNRKDTLDYKSNNYLKYVVSMPSEPETLVFYKSKRSEKWWLEIPSHFDDNRYDRNVVVPCSYSDYEAASKGEVPERYIHAQSKYY
jgi:formiminoglutamase